MKIPLFGLIHLSVCLTVHVNEYLPPPEYNAAIDKGARGLYPTRSYFTEEEIQSPETNFVAWNPECDDGLLSFITPRGDKPRRPGPMILDRRGELVWTDHFENKFGGQAYNAMVQKYKGEDFLTFWVGTDSVRGHGTGFYYMLNSSYDIVHQVEGANGMSADLHEFHITPEGTALITLYEVIPGDVSAYRKFDADKNPEDADPNWVWGCAIQEIDIETGDLLFEWHVADHYHMDEAYRPIYGGGTHADPWDWYHINSIKKDELGNFLISARYTHSITYIDGKTKQIIWQLGGKLNDFMDLSGGSATNFAWQHDAKIHLTDSFPHLYRPPVQRPESTTKLITVFDNAAEDQHYEFGPPVSRGLLLEITYPTPEKNTTRSKKPMPPQDTDLSRRETEDEVKIPMINGSDPAWTVRLIKSYENPNGVLSSSQGSMQLLPQGSGEDPRVFVGYGLNAVWTEYDANGTVLCDVHWAPNTTWEHGDAQSYRAYKFPWIGRPRWQPKMKISDDDLNVYASWNGATEVKGWILQSSEGESFDENAWVELGRMPKSRFETAIPVPADIGTSRFLRVIALSDDDAWMEYGITDVADRGVVAAHMPALNRVLPVSLTHGSPLHGLMVVVISITTMAVAYQACKRFVSWRLGRYGGSSIMWRKGPAYRLLSDRGSSSSG